MKYTAYFELYGKRMKTEIEANSVEDAKYKIMGKIVFHKVEQEKNVVDDILNLFGKFGG